VKPSSATNENIIDRTINLWQPRLQHDLTREDARQFIKNVAGFFTILAEWSRVEKCTSANEMRELAEIPSGGVFSDR
jgi:hypothetical protein